ncbi:MAG: UvrD-helicase domain-containing protein, partial [Bacteroidetes bacterium]|nr:UvrD-helicase domain-containing protein [Bacteroidota bacterium]
MNRDSDLKIFKASAGSGKTYTLAKEFVKILLVQPYHYKNILAITFTKKATAEMKSRILAFLKEIKENKNSNLTLEIIEEIQNEKGVDVSQKIQENAAKAINLILHDYGHFQVTTIDSFFQLIIRSFAKELKLPIGMQIELDTDSVLHKSIIKLLEESETENEIAQWLEEYALNNINNDKSWKIERSIFSLSKELLNEDYILLNEGFEQIRQADFSKYKAIADEQQKIINAYKKHILTKAKEAEKIIKQSGINAKLCSSN